MKPSGSIRGLVTVLSLSTQASSRPVKYGAFAHTSKIFNTYINTYVNKHKGLWPSQEWRRAPADKMMSNGSTETSPTGSVSEEPLEH